MQECEKPCGQHADKADRQVAVDDVTNESWKTITQINHTRWDNVTIKNGKSQMTLLDVPELLRCLWRHMRLSI